MTDRVTALRFAGVRVAAGACFANLVFRVFLLVLRYQNQ
jgi:hypothetical protein